MKVGGNRKGGTVSKLKHNANIDEQKLSYAIELIKGLDENKGRIEILNDCLQIMQFGGISMQDMLDYIEAVGE
jgi:hypothetical protein